MESEIQYIGILIYRWEYCFVLIRHWRNLRVQKIENNLPTNQTERKLKAFLNF